MAENESLDLGGPYAKRWDVPFDSIRKGASCKDVARKVEGALYSGLRKTLQQLLKVYGVSLSDMLSQRHSPRRWCDCGHHAGSEIGRVIRVRHRSYQSAADGGNGWFEGHEKLPPRVSPAHVSSGQSGR